MINSKYAPFVTIILAIAIAFFVYPTAFNVTADFLNSKIGLEKAGLKIPQLQTTPFRLGLDLLGGTHLVYKADLSQIGSSDVASAMSGVRDVIERRVNLFGVAEPLVQIEGRDQLVVELAGIKDVNQAINLIGSTPFLEFKEERTPEETQKILDAQKKGQSLTEDPYFKSTGLSGKYLKSAKVQFDPTTYQPQVSLELDSEGAKLFAEITKRNLNKRVAIYLDGTPISVPTVESEIPNGKAIISGKFTTQEAKDLTMRLNAGALPVPISLISQKTIGASLGLDSLEKSLKAGLYGLLMVAIFMIAFYRLPGVISVLVLLIYSVIVLAFYKLIPVTLTLAGIAGFILSLGMAVDANILIFARLREELKAGKSLNQAFNEGFHRAWFAIRDGHMTTLIGSVALYFFSTSMVKGFALTLGIGVLMSLFTATVMTRIFLNLFVGPWFEKRHWLF